MSLNQTLELAKLHCTDAYDFAQFAVACPGLYAWRKYKEIYSFNDELAETLLEQNDDIKLPVEALSRLPAPAVWIQFEGKNNGFFVWYDSVFVNGEGDILTLRVFGADDKNKVFIFAVSLIEGMTISEGSAHAVSYAPRDPLFDEKFARGLISVILYLCAENKEVEENPEQKQITARTATSVTAPKDVFREIRKWDVGFRVGKKISAAKRDAHQQVGHTQGGGGSVGTPKRSHVRRGHYHSYWVGSRSSGDRKLVLKWVAPTFINGGGDDVAAVVHEVE